MFQTADLDSRLIDSSEVVNLTRLTLLNTSPREDFCYSFLLEAESTPGPPVTELLEGLSELKKSINKTRGLHFYY
jgi:hypothetical protein